MAYWRANGVAGIVVVVVAALWAGMVNAADRLEECGLGELRVYRMLADAAERAYDDGEPGLEKTPSGCVALVRKDRGGNLVIAFRGSMLGDRNSTNPFSVLGGEVMRRNYRDWAATNLKQVAGFLPRQYIEAAALVQKHVMDLPPDKRVFVTGHSKGGGAAAYAFVAVNLSPEVSREQAERVYCVTFNAAVVKEQNWRRMLRLLGRDVDVAGREPADGSIRSLCMRDDPVSKIGIGEERPYVRRIIITPTTDLSPTEQHGIAVIRDELEKAYRIAESR